MSTNFHIIAVRYILPISRRPLKFEKDYVYFDCIQTPSVDTDVIMSNKKPIKAYKEWVRINANYPQEHIKNLKCFIKEKKELGYKIKCEAW
jgi:hypothetical protein